jgi:hypothetical protein
MAMFRNKTTADTPERPGQVEVAADDAIRDTDTQIIPAAKELLRACEGRLGRLERAQVLRVVIRLLLVARNVEVMTRRRSTLVEEHARYRDAITDALADLTPGRAPYGVLLAALHPETKGDTDGCS